MPFYSYSPWKDAAEFGGGVGRTLGAALAQKPEIAAQAALLRQRLSQGQQEEPLQLEIMKAQAKNLNYRPDYMGQLLQLKLDQQEDRNRQQEALLGIRKEGLDNQEKVGASLSALRDAQAKLVEEKANGGGASPWANMSGKLELMKSREAELDSTTGDKLPVNPDMDLKSLIMRAKTPEEAQSILSLAELQPNTVTNKVPHWFGADTDKVSTNSYSMKLPDEYKSAFGVSHTGEVPNASLPQASENIKPPTGMIRMKRPDGKTGLIDAKDLQRALDEHWEQIQ